LKAAPPSDDWGLDDEDEDDDDEDIATPPDHKGKQKKIDADYEDLLDDFDLPSAKPAQKANV
jgi:hypothetical protein